MSKDLTQDSKQPTTITYRPLQLEEIDGITTWVTRQVGWTTNDSTFLKLCHTIDPTGFIAAIHPDAGIVGLVLSLNMDENYSFAGLYVVSSEYRNLGIGKQLWDSMLDHVAPRCLGINSVAPRVKANMRNGMTEALFKVSLLNGKVKRDAFKPSHRVKNDPNIDININLGHYLDWDVNNNPHIKCDNWDPIKKPKEITQSTLQQCPNYDVLNNLRNLKFKVSHVNNYVTYAFRLVEGDQIAFESLFHYDTQIHGGIARKEFLKTYLEMSKSTDCRAFHANDKAASLNFTKCLVAIQEPESESTNETTIRGYGIIRPRVCHDKNVDRHLQNATEPCHYFIIGPLYADEPYVATVLLNALVKSLPDSWPIDLELTVPVKDPTCPASHNDQIRADFLNRVGREQLGLRCETDCYRMYQKVDKPRLNSITANDTTNKESLKIPNIQLHKVYSMLSSDIYLV